MRKLTFFCFITLCSFNVNAQIFRFSHYLEQGIIQNANFTLHRPSLIQLHPAIPLTGNITHQLTKKIFDTLVITVASQLSSSQPLKVRSSSTFTNTSAMAAGIPFVVVAGTEFFAPANTIINVTPGTIYVSTDYPSVQVNINTVGGIFPPGNEIKSLSTNLVQLTAKTKGIINVSGGKISFDPWQITNFVAVPSGSIDIDSNTPVPLELRDGRSKVSEPTKVLKVPYKHYTVSINSIPFRYRGKRVISDTVHSSGTVTTAFSLALSIGHTWGKSSITTRARNDYSFTLGAFVGPSTADLKKENVKNPSEFVAGRTNPVLSYGINTIFARNGFGILLAFGFDNAFGKYGNDWIYDDHIWFGFGISASFPK